MPRLRRMLASACGLIAVGTLTACVHIKPLDETDPHVITAEQIDAAKVPTAYDVIMKYRANFLTSRGPNSITLKQPKEPTVYLDNVEYGTINSLRNIPSVQIAQIRFIEGWDAMTKYGSDHIAGVIQIYTRTQ